MPTEHMKHFAESDESRRYRDRSQGSDDDAAVPTKEGDCLDHQDRDETYGQARAMHVEEGDHLEVGVRLVRGRLASREMVSHVDRAPYGGQQTP
jgi:hypothetical protein